MLQVYWAEVIIVVSLTSHNTDVCGITAGCRTTEMAWNRNSEANARLNALDDGYLGNVVKALLTLLSIQGCFGILSIQKHENETSRPEWVEGPSP